MQFNLRITKVCKLFLNGCSLSSLFNKKDSKNLGGPHTGDPNSSKPLLSRLMRLIVSGNSGKELSPDGQYSSHLERLMCKPKLGPELAKHDSKARREDLDPIKVPSSRYHKLRRQVSLRGLEPRN